jgi:hypothetical protein
VKTIEAYDIKGLDYLEKTPRKMNIEGNFDEISEENEEYAPGNWR